MRWWPSTVRSLPSCLPGGLARDGRRAPSRTRSGAQTRRLGSCLLTPFLAMPCQLAVTVPLVELAPSREPAGRRFVDVDRGASPLPLAVAGQPGRMAICSSTSASRCCPRCRSVLRAHRPPRAPGVAGPPSRRSPSISSSTARGGRLTVETFNGNVELGGDPFGRASSASRLDAPFHAIRVTGVRSRSSAARRDARARVLGTKASRSPALRGRAAPPRD